MQNLKQNSQLPMRQGVRAAKEHSKRNDASKLMKRSSIGRPNRLKSQPSEYKNAIAKECEKF